MKNGKVIEGLSKLLEKSTLTAEEREIIAAAIHKVDQPLETFIANEIPFRVEEGYIAGVDPELAEDEEFVNYLIDAVYEANDILFDYDGMDSGIADIAKEYHPAATS